MGIVVRDIDYSRDAMERGHTRLFRDLILYAWRIAMPPSVCDVKQLGECRAELRNIEDEFDTFFLRCSSCAFAKNDLANILFLSILSIISVSSMPHL